jgi:hypothetical protein
MIRVRCGWRGLGVAALVLAAVLGIGALLAERIGGRVEGHLADQRAVARGEARAREIERQEAARASAPPRAVVPAPAQAVTARQLHAAYRADAIAAQRRFGGGPLAVTGRVARIGADVLEQPVVMLETGEPAMDVQAAIAEADAAAALVLSPGGEVTLLCNEISALAGVAMLDGCRF